MQGVVTVHGGLDAGELRSYGLTPEQVLDFSHMGVSPPEDAPGPFHIATRSGRQVDSPDGALDAEGLTLGTYLHGLFHNREVRRGVLEYVASRKGATLPPATEDVDPDAEYDKLAALVRERLDMELVYRVMGLEPPATA